MANDLHLPAAEELKQAIQERGTHGIDIQAQTYLIMLPLYALSLQRYTPWISDRRFRRWSRNHRASA